LETRQDLNERKNRKFRLVKSLLERGWDAKQVRQLFRLINWLMELPRDLKIEFREQISRYEEERRMPFIDMFEETGMERGLAKGIEAVLEIRFGDAGVQLMPEIRQIPDAAQLQEILQAAKHVASPEELREKWVKGAQDE
jgi:hypothetical protein